MAKLSIIFGNKCLDVAALFNGKTCLIGRDTACDIVIDEPIVSFHHARIESQGKGFLLVDLNSSNGTFVNRKRIDAFWLNDGDAISVGNHILVFSNPLVIGVRDKNHKSVVETIPMDKDSIKNLIPRKKSKALMGSNTKIMGSMVLIRLSDNRKLMSLGARPITLGKASTSDIVVKGLWVGKRAGVIEKLEDGWHLRSLGGFVRPRINGQAIETPTKLQQFDIISLGKTRVQVMLE